MPALGEGLKFKYEPILEQAPLDKEFHYYEEKEDGTRELKINTKGFKLISSIEELKPYIELCKDKLVAWDTETTGLTYGKDKIVGFSLSISDMTGIYVPIRHKITLVTKQKTEKRDENGNAILTKSGKASTKTIEIKEYLECDENLPAKEALDIMYEILVNAKLVIAHNSEFDLNVLKFEGYNVNKINCFDSLILPYLYDPEGSGMAGLKALEKRLLGREVPEFKDVLGKSCENFACVKPSDAFIYACCDTAGLYGVFKKLYPMVKELLGQVKNPLIVDGKPYNVLNSDNKMVKAFVDYYGHAKILIDREKACQYEKQLEHRQTQVIKSIFDYFGRGPFNLSTSSNEFKEVMESKHVFTGILTAKDSPSWSRTAAEEMRRNLVKVKESMLAWKEITFEKNTLSKSGKGFVLSQMLEIYGDEFFNMDITKNSIKLKGKNGEPVDKKYFWLNVKEMYLKNMERYNILQLIQENNSLNKALNSYVDKLTEVDECKMHYRLKGTKSGRLSSGNGSKSDKRKNHYYIDLNAQNLTKPKSGYYSAEKCDMNDPEGILGWKFTPLEKDYAMEHLEDMYIVEGQDPGITIRGCLKAPEGRYVVSLDYDAEELKVQCVISGDTKVKENFIKGIDPHEATAVGIWGAENYDKGKRKKAKAINFLMAYLGSAPTLADYIDCPVEEAQEIIDKYEQAFPETKIWKMRSIEEMYNNGGVVFSAFGRPRSFKGWLNIISTHMDDYDTLEEKISLERNSNRVKNAIERRTVNHKIQSTCGDILRVVLLRLYERYFKNRDLHIDFLSTVHDEINYTIDKEVTTDYVRELEQLMTFDALDKSLPITTSTDIGYTYGNMFPFVWEDEKKLKLIPKRVHHA